MQLQGVGLRNEYDAYNCFLNVVVQSLWHLEDFRDETLALTPLVDGYHANTNVLESLCDLFSMLQVSRTGTAAVERLEHNEAPDPQALRLALKAAAATGPYQTEFEATQHADAMEALEAIFNSIFRELSPPQKQEEDAATFWSEDFCAEELLMSRDIMHRHFALDIRGTYLGTHPAHPPCPPRVATVYG